MDLSRRGFLAGSLVLAGVGVLGGGGPLGGGTAWAAGGPSIIDCDGWGARASSRPVDVVSRRPVKILVHHTATRNVPDLGRGAAESLARSIQRFHMDSRGWLDSGQHFTISRGGHVLEGRRRSLEALRSGRLHVVGAHCTGQNLVSIGIENEGTYLDVDPPGGLFSRLRELCAYACERYGIAPTEIYGHRDFKDTACPGDRLYRLLPRLRSEVGELLGRRVTKDDADPPIWPLLRIGDTGAAVTAAQYLLRDAGIADVEPDGRYDEPVAEAVRRLQTALGGDPSNDDEVTGVIAGESWPVLARTVRLGDGPPSTDAERAVEALVAGAGAGRGTESLPTEITPEVWQRLLAPPP